MGRYSLHPSHFHPDSSSSASRSLSPSLSTSRGGRRNPPSQEGQRREEKYEPNSVGSEHLEAKYF